MIGWNCEGFFGDRCRDETGKSSARVSWLFSLGSAASLELLPTNALASANGCSEWIVRHSYKVPAQHSLSADGVGFRY